VAGGSEARIVGPFDEPHVAEPLDGDVEPGPDLGLFGGIDDDDLKGLALKAQALQGKPQVIGSPIVDDDDTESGHRLQAPSGAGSRADVSAASWGRIAGRVTRKTGPSGVFSAFRVPP
jgi:hypothetical protein